MLNIQNLGHRTNVHYNSFFGEIIERNDYWVIKTPVRPNFFWGNYILMKSSPTQGCYNEWVQIFESEIGPRNKRGFMAITFDSIEEAEKDLYIEFEQAGCTIIINKMLTASSIHSTDKVSDTLIVKPFSSETDWNAYKDIHLDPDWGYGTQEAQSRFLDEEINDFKKIVKMNKGQRFGAFENNVMIAELGVFWDGEVARFNNVATAIDHRRKGACSTLVYEVSKFLLEQKDISTLVMEADENYHASRIYESLGFKPTQKTISFQWHDRIRFGA